MHRMWREKERKRKSESAVAKGQSGVVLQAALHLDDCFIAVSLSLSLSLFLCWSSWVVPRGGRGIVRRTISWADSWLLLSFWAKIRLVDVWLECSVAVQSWWSIRTFYHRDERWFSCSTQLLVPRVYVNAFVLFGTCWNGCSVYDCLCVCVCVCVCGRESVCVCVYCGSVSGCIWQVSSCRWCWTPTLWTSWAWRRRSETPLSAAGCRPTASWSGSGGGPCPRAPTPRGSEGGRESIYIHIPLVRCFYPKQKVWSLDLIYD